MQPDLQSTRRWQRLLLSCSVLVSTVIVGGQVAVAAAAIAVEPTTTESVAAESISKSGIRAIATESAAPVDSMTPALSTTPPDRSLDAENLPGEWLESVKVGTETTVSPAPASGVTPEEGLVAEPITEFTTAPVTPPSRERRSRGLSKLPKLRFRRALPQIWEPMPTNRAIANTDVELDPDLSRSRLLSSRPPSKFAQTGPPRSPLCLQLHRCRGQPGHCGRCRHRRHQLCRPQQNCPSIPYPLPASQPC
ncbi:hypothetical protein O77CONTIG1_01864 [Leptolyngbya sp. O-77]|nr:hypothetical protein O77CONTIG1_01864 [Leptolyngbya sp. O-77]